MLISSNSANKVYGLLSIAFTSYASEPFAGPYGEDIDFGFASPVAASHAACPLQLSPAKYAGTFVTKVIITEHPFYISTNVVSNTSFEIAPELTFTVGNAPTVLDLTTTSVEKNSQIELKPPSASTTSRDGPDGVGSAAAFIIHVTSNKGANRKRQDSSGTFFGPGGNSTTSCANAGTYTISQGRLFEQYNGTVGEFSAPSGAPYVLFQPSQSVSSITTTFLLTTSGELVWQNETFYGGAAQFCILQDGTFIAVFELGGQPFGCVFVELTVTGISNCPLNAGPVSVPFTQNSTITYYH